MPTNRGKPRDQRIQRQRKRLAARVPSRDRYGDLGTPTPKGGQLGEMWRYEVRQLVLEGDLLFAAYRRPRFSMGATSGVAGARLRGGCHSQAGAA